MFVDSQDNYIDELKEIKLSSRQRGGGGGGGGSGGSSAIVVAPSTSLFNLTPGQQVKVERETRMLFNPENVLNRNALNENYSLQLPLIEKKEKLKVAYLFFLKSILIKFIIFFILKDVNSYNNRKYDRSFVYFAFSLSKKPNSNCFKH